MSATGGLWMTPGEIEQSLGRRKSREVFEDLIYDRRKRDENPGPPDRGHGLQRVFGGGFPQGDCQNAPVMPVRSPSRPEGAIPMKRTVGLPWAGIEFSPFFIRAYCPTTVSLRVPFAVVSNVTEGIVESVSDVIGNRLSGHWQRYRRSVFRTASGRVRLRRRDYEEGVPGVEYQLRPGRHCRRLRFGRFLRPPRSGYARRRGRALPPGRGGIGGWAGAPDGEGNDGLGRRVHDAAGAAAACRSDGRAGTAGTALSTRTT